MRTFALLMVVLNFGYFFWSQASGSTLVEGSIPKAIVVPADSTLVMLAELEPPALDLQGENSSGNGTESRAMTLIDQSAGNPVLPFNNPVQDGLPQGWCGMVAGFDAQADAVAFISDIRDMGIVGSLDIRQEEISSTWWVHLPPFESQVEAQKVIDELTIKGIDNFYMRTGELAGGISLGVFSRQNSAEVARSELAQRGYETSIKEIPRYVSKAYVTLNASDAELVETTAWRAFLTTKTKLEVTEKLCETIAR